MPDSTLPLHLLAGHALAIGHRPSPAPAACAWPARGLLLILLVSLSGCALPPPQQASAGETPAAWSDNAGFSSPTPGGETAQTGDPGNAAWWSRFDDTLLTELVARALQANTRVEGAQAALRQARALRDLAAAGLLPSVGGSASAQRSAVGGNDAGSSFRVGLDANWELDLFGFKRSALAASEASRRASAASLGDVQVSIAAEVALAYIALRGTQAQLLIARDNLASQQQTLQITEWRQQAGLVTVLETEQARASAEQTAAQLPTLQTRIVQSQHALAVLTGQNPAALASALAPPGPLPRAPDNLALSLPADTLRQRPDVRAAEAQVAVAAAQLTQADAARLPSLRLGGSLGLNALTLGSLGSGSALAGSLLAGLSAPLFDGGAGSAQVRAQQAALDQAQSTYRASVLLALQEVEDALVALRGDRERLQRLQRAAAAATNAAQLARQRYSSGLVDFQTVLETQRTQLSTQDSLASAGTELAADHVRLYKALGGGWRADGEGAGEGGGDAVATVRPAATPALASITPPAKPRQPAWAAPTARPPGAANSSGRQSATCTAQAMPGSVVTLASASWTGAPGAPSARPRRTTRAP